MEEGGELIGFQCPTPRSTLLVSNLAPETNEIDLESRFKLFGLLYAVKIFDKDFTAGSTQKVYRFAFIEYYSAIQAKQALCELNDVEVRGKKMNVRFCKPKGPERAFDLPIEKR
eukprot:TRINITY_DN3476_c0_g1_i2.p1 TRINITY_DN3476_c0_g1~~TRINITY_DN3476_c0_g1_i2.p1  ORF type:complete len:114 (-),score=7.28 TRINITY_DN3476_c0_g1_i2:506-847(-)